MLYIIRSLIQFFFGAPVRATTTTTAVAETTAEPTAALKWDVIDTAPDANWTVIEFEANECEDFVAVINDREYMTYSRTRKFATVNNRSNRGGWSQFTARVDLVRHWRNGYCVGQKAVLAGGTSAQTFQIMVAQRYYSDVERCQETIQFLNW